jgi:predicted  nucleic acid-binding Zn-ribbon protein
MPREKRRIIWHCAAGHDFEVEDELMRTSCPVCGGNDVERVLKEKGKDRPPRGSVRSWFWR